MTKPSDEDLHEVEVNGVKLLVDAYHHGRDWDEAGVIEPWWEVKTVKTAEPGGDVAEQLGSYMSGDRPDAAIAEGLNELHEVDYGN
jgi:hypothetical protein